MTTPPTALITGGTRGIGLGIARALAREGWHLALSGVRADSEVQEVIAELGASGSQVHYFRSDVSNADDRGRLVNELRDRYSVVNALVNNAGRAPRVRADLLESHEQSFEELLRTNLQGPYFLTQAVARDMLAKRRADAAFVASIIFVTSVSAEMASVNRGEYCVSKAGVAMTVRLFALRLAADGIPVYEVRPGVIATDMTAGVKELYDKRIEEGLIPERRWGKPDDVGRVVAALLRGDAPHSTGSVIHIDGGLSIPRL